MKVCLYLEYFHFMGGIMYKNVGTGLVSSYKNQRDVLKSLDIPFVEAWDDSCDLLQINTPWMRSLMIMRRARKLNKKIVVWAHVTAEDTVGVFRFTKLMFPLTRKYLTYAYGLADLVFCPSEHTKELLIDYGIAAERLVVLSNGVNTEKFFADEKRREECRKQHDLKGVVVGTVALAIPRKGIDTFLALARKFPDNQFIWYGKIYSAVMAEGLPKDLPANVKFTGYVDDVVAAMNSLDIFIFPSYEENQGMVIMEAGAVGLPILVRNLPAYRRWLKDGESSLKAEDQAGFEEHLGALIKDKELRERLGRGGKQMADSESIKEIGKTVLGYYDRLLGTSK